MPHLWQCEDCGKWRVCDYPAADDWPDGVLHGIPPDCSNEDCSSLGCPMELLEADVDPKDYEGQAT